MAYLNGKISNVVNDPELMALVQIDLYPFGNAKMDAPATSGSGKMSCENGPRECEANTMEACAIQLGPKFRDAGGLKFVRCAQGALFFGTPEQALEACATGAQRSAVKSCADGP